MDRLGNYKRPPAPRSGREWCLGAFVASKPGAHVLPLPVLPREHLPECQHLRGRVEEPLVQGLGPGPRGRRPPSSGGVDRKGLSLSNFGGVEPVTLQCERPCLSPPMEGDRCAPRELQRFKQNGCWGSESFLCIPLSGKSLSVFVSCVRYVRSCARYLGRGLAPSGPLRSPPVPGAHRRGTFPRRPNLTGHLAYTGPTLAEAVRTRW